MRPQIQEIIKRSRSAGWVVEPLAKEMLQVCGLPVCRYVWAKSSAEALAGARQLGYPLVAKIVSPQIVHKSDVGGVIVGIKSDEELLAAYQWLSSLAGFDGVLLDEFIRGVELIVGAKEDPQFGMVVLVGIGGVAVEIYQDVVIRMAPLTETVALQAIEAIKGHKLLEGYRGRTAISKPHLVQLLVRFSQFALDLANDITSIDLNPVLCHEQAALIADARIILK